MKKNTFSPSVNPSDSFTGTASRKKQRVEHNKSGLPLKGKKWLKLSAGLAAWHEAEDGHNINPKHDDWFAL